MDVPIRVAWCNLLFTSNGGRLDQRNLPILSSYERFESDDPNDPRNGTWIHGKRGYCDRAWDCDQCFLLQKFLEHEKSQGRAIFWECTDCAFTPMEGYLTNVPGYYTSCLWAVEDPRNVEDLDPTCLRCQRETSFLQLVLRVPA